MFPFRSAAKAQPTGNRLRSCSRSNSPLQCALGSFLKEKTAKKKHSLEPALQSWLKKKGLPEQKVEIAPFQQQGRGLKATSRINKGEQLLQIPESVLLTPDGVAERTRLGALLEKAELPAWSLLAAVIAETRFAGRDSEWSPYAQALPSSTGCVLEWSSEEVELLRGSGLHSEAEGILKAAHTSTEELCQAIEEAERDRVIEKNVLSEKRLRWAFGILLSRLVRLPSMGNVEALCPWADMINHDCSATTHLDYDARSKTVCLTTDRSYATGEQVVASYGNKTSGQLLLSYGFAPDPKENPHDGCFLRLSLSNEDPWLDAKTQALQQFGLRSSLDFPLRIGALPSGVLQFAAYMDAEPGSAAEAMELAAWLFDRGQFPKLDGVDTELLGLEVLIEECRAALEHYPESITECQETLKKLTQFPSAGDSSSMSSQNRKALITAVKLQEQKVLNRTLFVLQQRRKEVA